MSQIETQRLVLRSGTGTDSEGIWFDIHRKTDDAVIGFAGIEPNKGFGNELMLVASIADGYRNMGYATEAGKAMVWWAFMKAGQDVLAATAMPEEEAAHRLLEKLGFVHGGKRRLTQDGAESNFDYCRLYHTDYLPGPEWDARTVYRPEPMSTFFDVRAERYNEHMLSYWGEESYKRFGSFIPQTADGLCILDVGCGTGIELDHIWNHAPNAHVTCVDVSRGMLDLLLKNHPGSHGRITTVEASYLNWEYPVQAFDLVVSGSTMHHWWPDEKVAVYRKILGSLKPGGCYIENDFIVDAILAEQYRRRYASITSHLPDKPKPGEYHIDIPCTVETQIRLLKEAGFSLVEVLDEDTKPRGSGAILRARK